MPDDSATRNYARWTLFLTLIGTIAAVIQTYVIVIELLKRVDDVEASLKTVIASPLEDEAVDPSFDVVGRTFFVDLKNYLVITDVPTGTNYLQGGRLELGPDGTWRQRAVFGEAGNCGVRFLVRSFATKETLQKNAINVIPEDAKFSRTVTVRRKCP
jgi:hypothetical protein